MRLPALKLEATGSAPPAEGTPLAALAATLRDHRRFLADCGAGASLGELLAPLSELLHDPHAPQLAFELWVELFPRAWALLRADEQEALVRPLVTMLSREWHQRQQGTSPNVVQGWLQALLACRPMPKLPAALLQYLGKTFSAWHLAVPLLEHQALLSPAEPQWYDGLSEITTQLNDRDLYCALCQRAGIITLLTVIVMMENCLRRQRNHNLAKKIGCRTTKDQRSGAEAQRGEATSKHKSR